MATINKEHMTPRQVSGVAHTPVACLYGFGELEDQTPFVELATRNPESAKGEISQTLRIPKPELLMLIGEMMANGMLKFADLDDLVSMMKSTKP